ncbi:hypothetical protein EJ06DRAFT_68095 [Trichodelitschia bisporula]|uniref:Uncharacterized protein n=1 Tax=Trichodelitschia bisporula TaxID=703511 RepID=A0A6G1HSY8_9PEZI|nr:hypothetical protein EJ06DRAFT_68095 [Trichodelitschia bisporula]
MSWTYVNGSRDVSPTANQFGAYKTHPPHALLSLAFLVTHSPKFLSIWYFILSQNLSYLAGLSPIRITTHSGLNTHYFCCSSRPMSCYCMASIRTTPWVSLRFCSASLPVQAQRFLGDTLSEVPDSWRLKVFFMHVYHQCLNIFAHLHYQPVCTDT